MARMTTPWPSRPRTVFFDDVASPPTLSKAVADERIRRLASGVYSADLDSQAADIVAANIWSIIARRVPDAVIVDRTAAADGRIDEGVVTISTDRRSSPLDLPGVRVLVRGLQRSAADMPWADGLTMSDPARTLVDNLADSRARGLGGVARTLRLDEIGDWLARKSLAWGPTRMERLQLASRELAVTWGHPERGEQIDRLFDELQGRRGARSGSGQLLRATSKGEAWDEARMHLFERVAAQLADPAVVADVPEHLAPPASGGDVEFAFHEAYFSNYIEGTEFELDEARDIVETGQSPAQRSADGHDILGTYRCVSDPAGRAVAPDDVAELAQIMQRRHAALMVGRPDRGPGEWKLRPNRAGSVTFVTPDLVEGTVAKGLSLRHIVPAGFCRALYVMFMLAEVHPFVDGNGRTARLMMNAELSAVGQCRMIVPTVIRNEYIGALRRVTRHGDVGALVSVLTHCWRWSAAMPWADRAAVAGQLVATNATMDSNEAAVERRYLEVP